MNILKEQVNVLRVDNRADVWCLRLHISDFVNGIPPTLSPSSMFTVFITYSRYLVVVVELFDPCL